MNALHETLLRKIGKNDYFDLSLLGTETMKEEFRRYIRYRGTQLCQVLQTRRNLPKSLMDWEEKRWIQLLKAWIQKAIQYTEERYGETVYIFVDEKDTGRPLQYTTIKHKVLGLIQREDLRDDEGNKGVNAVMHYRKMSNQILADETRRAREAQTRILLANLEGWGEDYEQIR